MAIINVDDAYILNETGAQVDKTTGIPFKNESLTEAEAAQARANIRAGGSNPNLLDNAYFVGGGSQLGDGVFPINQRGLTSYSWSGATCIDRWYIFAANATVTLSASGLTVNAPENGGVLGQRIRYYPEYSQQPLICTFLTTDNKRIVWSFTINTSASWQGGTLVLNECPDFYVDALYDISSNTVAFVLAKSFDNIPHSITLKAAKLELGTVSTLANDVPPDFGEELRKCQRYFVRLKADIIYQSFGLGITDSADGTSASYTVPIPLPTALRAATTNVTFSNIAGFDGTAFRTISSILLIRISGTVPVATIVFSLLGSFTNGQPVLLLANQAGAYIDISAEL